MNSPRPPRYALYFAPRFDSPWHAVWSAWLGRCALTSEGLAQPPVGGLTHEQIASFTEDPRRYGLHATLKAPFRLAAGVELSDLQTCVAQVCARHYAFDFGSMEVALIGDFLALVPIQPSAALHALADDCVIAADQLRDPLTKAELERRRSKGLTVREDALLQRWGYPHVLDQFRFHISLTGGLGGASAAQVAAVRGAAERQLTALQKQPLPMDAICIFQEPQPGADFHCVDRLALV